MFERKPLLPTSCTIPDVMWVGAVGRGWRHCRLVVSAHLQSRRLLVEAQPDHQLKNTHQSDFITGKRSKVSLTCDYYR